MLLFKPEEEDDSESTSISFAFPFPLALALFFPAGPVFTGALFGSLELVIVVVVAVVDTGKGLALEATAAKTSNKLPFVVKDESPEVTGKGTLEEVVVEVVGGKGLGEVEGEVEESEDKTGGLPEDFFLAGGCFLIGAFGFLVVLIGMGSDTDSEIDGVADPDRLNDALLA